MTRRDKQTAQDQTGPVRAGRLGGLARAGGRVVLWACIVVVLIRGLGAIIAPSSAGMPGREAGDSPASRVADGGAIDAIAVRFATAYLADPTTAGLRRSVGGLLADGVAARIPPRAGAGGGAAVRWATVAGRRPAGRGRWMVTVAAALAGGRWRYLAVPVARGDRGGLAVHDLPAVVSPPARADGADEPVEPLSGPSSGAVADVATRFVRAYVSGADRSRLAYFLAPTARLTRMPDGLAVASVGEIDQLPSGGEPGELTVVVSAQVRDPAAGLVLAARYRLRLVREDRWYVQAVLGGPRA